MAVGAIGAGGSAGGANRQAIGTDNTAIDADSRAVGAGSRAEKRPVLPGGLARLTAGKFKPEKEIRSDDPGGGATHKRDASQDECQPELK